MTGRSKTECQEIEITPAMVEAGLEHFFGYDERFGNERDVVVEIFRAMLLVSKREHPIPSRVPALEIHQK